MLGKGNYFSSKEISKSITKKILVTKITLINSVRVGMVSAKKIFIHHNKIILNHHAVSNGYFALWIFLILFVDICFTGIHIVLSTPRGRWPKPLTQNIHLYNLKNYKILIFTRLPSQKFPLIISSGQSLPVFHLKPCTTEYSFDT